MNEIAKLKRERLKLMSEARAINFADELSVDELKELERNFGELMAEVDRIDLEILEHEERGNGDSRRPSHNGYARGNGERAAGSVRRPWIDVRSGEEVRVVQRGERFATEDSEVRMGAVLRAMVCGARNEAEKRALGEGTDSAGGYTVPAPLAADFIDRLRARARVFQAGAQTVEMTSETLQIAKVVTDPAPAWRDENAAIAETDPAFGRVLFVARSLACLTKVSRELLADSANAEAALEAAFAGAFANEIDRVALVGSGTAPEPQGLFGATGVTEVSMGTNGAALTGYGEILQLLQALEDANATDPTAWIMAPRSNYTLAGLVATDDQPLMPPSVVSEIPILSTSQVPVDQDQGTANDASTIFAGDFRQVMVGVRSQFRIDVLRERFADNHQIGLVGWARLDVQLAQPAALGRLVGVTP